MPVHLPDTVDAAVGHLAQHPQASVLAGGTDLMVDVNEGHRRPDETVVVVNRIPELRSWRRDGSSVTIGAAVSYREIEVGPVGDFVPALAEAARTVGSPQIRNAGTLGGNLGTCSPAGDGLPVLAALDATVELASTSGRRTLPVRDFMLGPKRTALVPGELIVSVTMPLVDGWQGYAKVGVRNAMVIAVASACVVLDRTAERAAVAVGSVGPTVLRCPGAEQLLNSSMDWANLQIDDAALERVGASVSAESRPITDHRSSADYRRHAVGVLARRLVRRAGTGAVAA
jgi:CO/xanthine dehydrogenase FAD-binding subunit